MAYADIPINMRPALAELHATTIQPGLPLLPGMLSSTGAAGARLSVDMDAPEADYVRGAAGVAGVAGGIKATQVELVRGALLGCLKMLRQMSEALGKYWQ
eukprot:GHUV01026515.1.p2 GENE.GHUV01026515.1~~GHUV01026515.1.p2  ORF type:complete len:100 (-),score=29.78 GHUV01026515.1:138-437(-)